MRFEWQYCAIEPKNCGERGDFEKIIGSGNSRAAAPPFGYNRK
jgi:hypothetical protein